LNINLEAGTIMFFFRHTTIAIYLTSITIHSVAQNDSAHTPKKDKSLTYIASYPRNILGYVKAPLGWTENQWFQFGGSTLLVGALIPMDNVLNIPFENWQTDAANTFGDVGDVVGGLPFQFGISGAALGVGLVSKNKNWQHFALDNLQAQLFTGGVTFIVKELTHRARPETGEDNYAWYGPFEGKGNDAFFSGHTSLAFSTATMIFLHTGKKWWVGLLGYSIASAVGISRMQQQKHWASDVVAGALVGTATSQFIFNQQQKRRAQQSRLKQLP
jgi:membrane-associated phospholipid phosphatase